MTEHNSNGGVSFAKQINWTDINFPPLYRVAHFSIAELKGKAKTCVIYCYSSFLIVGVVLCLNLLSTIIQVACDYTDGINLFYSFINFFVLLPAAGYVFHFGYVSVSSQFEGKNAIMKYRIYQTILCLFWLVFSAVPAGCFDGWGHISDLSGHHSAAASFCIFLCFVESLGFTASVILAVISMFTIASAKEDLDSLNIPQSRI